MRNYNTSHQLLTGLIFLFLVSFVLISGLEAKGTVFNDIHEQTVEGLAEELEFDDVYSGSVVGNVDVREQTIKGIAEGFVIDAAYQEAVMTDFHQGKGDKAIPSLRKEKRDRKSEGIISDKVFTRGRFDVEKLEGSNLSLEDEVFKELREFRSLQMVDSGLFCPDCDVEVWQDERPVGELSSQKVIRSVLNEQMQEQKIDLDFDKATLGDIVVTVATVAKSNIVLDPALINYVMDLHLQKVTIEEALLMISQIYDLGFRKVGDSLYIAHKDKLKSNQVFTRIIKLRNVNVEEIEALVEDIVPIVNASNELNSIVITGGAQEISEVERIIRQIDIPQPQVILEAKIIEINRDALKDLGIDWSDQINLSYQESGRPVDFDDIEDSPGSPIEIFQIARNAIQFETVIKMLENQNKAKVLSNPRVTTLTDKEAEIFVGDELPYTVTNVTGGVVTTDVRFVEPGIRLKITPSIIADDFVVIKVEPEVSFIFAFRGPNDEFPQVKTREATAHVRIKNNQPFVLGGLLSQEDKQNLFKVPFLGNIPLLGNLFSYEKHSVLDTELIITIIPKIVHGN